MARRAVILVACAFALLLSACQPTTAETTFRKTHRRQPDCDLGGRYSDCKELASLESEPSKRAVWLERGCTHDQGDLCVERVGASDYPAKGVDKARAIELLTTGCIGRHPGRSCSELVFRRLSLIDTFAGSAAGIDTETLRYAERACALGGGSLPLLGFGPSPCYFVGRAFLEGLAGRPKDPMRAALLFEQGCEQEIELAESKGGPSCFYAARVYLDQPLVGRLIPDRKPIDEAKAKALLERGCATGQRDCCGELGRSPK